MPERATPAGEFFGWRDAGVGRREVECPRCGETTDEDYYGPCSSCRAALRGLMAVERRAVAVAEYEPKMNVTPNAVALKDD